MVPERHTTDAARVVACARNIRSAWSATARSRASSHHAATAAAASVPAVATVKVSAWWTYWQVKV